MDNPIGRFRMPGLCGWLHTLLRTMFQKISCPYRSVHDVLQVANIICCYLVPHDTSWLATLVPKNPFAFSKPYVETAPTRCRRTALRLRPKVVLQRQRGRAVPEASRRGGAKNIRDLAWITWMFGCLDSDWWRKNWYWYSDKKISMLIFLCTFGGFSWFPKKWIKNAMKNSSITHPCFDIWWLRIGLEMLGRLESNGMFPRAENGENIDV